MINNAIERIEQLESIEYAALSCYTPKDAIYVIVNKDLGGYKVISTERFSYNSKFVCMDYYSNLININKPVDAKKKILSNNYLTFFCRKLSELTEQIIDNYYARTGTQENYTLHKAFIKNNLKNFNKISDGHLLKVFFLDDIEKYVTEGKRYLYENILSAKTKIEKNDIHEYGVPQLVNMNAKKPYLYNLTRGTKKYKQYPLLFEAEEAYKRKCFLDILRSLYKKKYNMLYIMESGKMIPSNINMPCKFKIVNGLVFCFAIDSKGEIDIQNMEIISGYNPRL